MVLLIRSQDIFAVNLKYYRYQLNLSQEDFANAIGVTLHYESDLENSKRNPTLKTLDKLANNISLLLEMAITPADLITYDANKVINFVRIDKKERVNQ